ncbi:MAG: LysM peptidoglycan-binding domain-containing protein [Pseudomonadota bacterium]|nr:LysM peptidoglycan-binding domain-containing protein [Pseudomonadota bacterium]
MQYKRRTMSAWGIMTAVLMVLCFAGCAKKAVTAPGVAAPGDRQAVAETARAGEPAKTGEARVRPTTGPAAESSSGPITEYVVKKGDSLWWIAKYRDIYNDPYLWPLLYQANKDQIKKAGLIYPGQRLKIPRSGFTAKDLEKARQQAGAKRPYKPSKDSRPPID